MKIKLKTSEVIESIPITRDDEWSAEVRADYARLLINPSLIQHLAFFSTTGKFICITNVQDSVLYIELSKEECDVLQTSYDKWKQSVSPESQPI